MQQIRRECPQFLHKVEEIQVYVILKSNIKFLALTGSSMTDQTFNTRKLLIYDATVFTRALYELFENTSLVKLHLQLDPN